MKEKEMSRFKFPCVTKEEILGFDIEREETWTASPIVNAVLDAIEVVRPLKGSAVAQFIGVDPKEMSAALHLATGMGFLELIDMWRKERFHRILEEEPGIASKDMVERMAFASQGALWTFLMRNKMIEPMRPHWDYGRHLRLRKEVAEGLVDDSWKEEYKTELRRRKWEIMTKNKM